MVQEQPEQGESQIIAGYACQCGFTTDDKKTFTNHLLLGGRDDGKGVHKSLGRINLQTKESLMGPWVERTDAQKAESTYAPSRKRNGNGSKGDARKTAPVRQTDILADATQLRFVPRIFTCDYTPEMRMARDICIRYWGWNADMPLHEMLNIILRTFFQDRGITLAGYIFDEDAQRALEDMKAQKQQEEEFDGAEV